MNLLTLRTSAADASAPGPLVDDGGDSLFVLEDSPAKLPQLEPASSGQLTDTLSMDRTLSAEASDPASGGKGVADVAQWSATDRALYRSFCEDVAAAEGRSDHQKTRNAMSRLRGREPLLQPTFLKCAALARRTMGEDVICEWRKFQEQGWERRREHARGVRGPRPEPPAGSPPTPDPARRDVVAAAYRELQEIFKAKTNDWKARFQYRRAAVRLTGQYETYAELRDRRPAGSASAPRHDRSMLLRALFREMQPDWRDALAENFTDKQAKEQGYGHEWRTFGQTIQDGRRWGILTGHLGLGALLLIDTSGSNDYVQRQIPMPIFAAWVQLISRVRSDVKEVAARVVGYFDGMEDPSFFANRKLKPLKLERRAYRAHSPGEQFDFSGSEGARTPTAEPGCLMRPEQGAVWVEECSMDEFVESNPLTDDDFVNLPGLGI